MKTLIKTKRFIVISGLLFLLTNCTHYYYIPPAQNVPLFKEKGEIRGSLHSGGGMETGTFDLQTAYAITDKFAVMANYMSARGLNETSTNWAKGKYADAAFGYYRPIEKYGVFEVFGGIGGSKQYHSFDIRSGNGGSLSSSGQPQSSITELNCAKFFVQPSIGFTTGILDIAATYGICYLTFQKLKNVPPDLNAQKLGEKRNSLLCEPGITLRLGWKYLKLQGQVVYSKNLSHENMPFEEIKASIGLSFAFANRFSKKSRVHSSTPQKFEMAQPDH